MVSFSVKLIAEKMFEMYIWICFYALTSTFAISYPSESIDQSAIATYSFPENIVPDTNLADSNGIQPDQQNISPLGITNPIDKSVSQKLTHQQSY